MTHATRPAISSVGDAPAVCLCIPTFRRPYGLRNLLAYVERLDYAGRLNVIVVDNDAEMHAGKDVVDAAAPAFRFPLSCLIEPRRGHTYAYDTAFVAACRRQPAPDYIAVLDDDEFPDSKWLEIMVDVALKHGVDIVGGPVFPVFEEPDHWLATSGLFAPARFATGRVRVIYGAGSMLIRRTTLEQYLDEPFLHDFATTGGSDEEFFWRCHRDGKTFAWADDAHVYETTPPSRTTIGYVLLRKFRAGTGAVRLERKFFGAIASAPRRVFKAVGLLSIGILSLPMTALRGRRAIMRSLIVAARGAGRIAAEFGILYEEYK